MLHRTHYSAIRNLDKPGDEVFKVVLDFIKQLSVRAAGPRLSRSNLVSFTGQSLSLPRDGTAFLKLSSKAYDVDDPNKF